MNKGVPRSEAANLIRERPKEKEVSYRVHKLEDRRERSRERQKKNDRYRRSASTGTGIVSYYYKRIMSVCLDDLKLLHRGDPNLTFSKRKNASLIQERSIVY
jgi:hypothetical protein